MVVINDEAQIKMAPTKVLLQTAEDIVTDFSNASRIFDDANLDRLSTFSRAEIKTGRIIGRGGFCTVTEIAAIRNGNGRGVFLRRERSHSPAMSMSHNGDEMSAKVYIVFSCNRGKGSRYVIKQVAEESLHTNRIAFLKGTVDLALEAKFLSSLSHPNIVELKGVSEGGPFREGYFLVMDRLHETLPTKLKKWMTTDRQCKGITGFFAGGKKKINALFVDRMTAAYGVAMALNYLHSLRIVYRDLVCGRVICLARCFKPFKDLSSRPLSPQKPDNIGFDAQGNVKLFDFGLAKELRDSDKTVNGLYKLTGFTGSIRYMAPEVGLRLPYNQKVDNCKYTVGCLAMYSPSVSRPDNRFHFFCRLLQHALVVHNGLGASIWLLRS